MTREEELIEMLKILALLEKTYADFCNCEGGEGWLKIDGKKYSTDAGYAIEGVDIFMEVFKRRLAELPSVTPQEPKTGHWIADVDKWGDVVTTVNGYKCSECGEFNADNDNYCPNCGAKMVEQQEGEVKNEI